MEQVLISRYELTAERGASFPSEELHLNYGKIKLTYSQQKRADGVAAGNVSAGWDLITNKAIA